MEKITLTASPEHLIDPETFFGENLKVGLPLSSGYIERPVLKIVFDSIYFTEGHIEKPMTYILQNKDTHNFYIGASSKTRHRMRFHLRKFRRGLHYLKTLQEDYNNHGPKSLLLTIIEAESIEQALAIEQYLLDRFFTLETCQNKVPTAINVTTRSEQARKNMSEAQKKVVMTPEWRANISKATKGRKRPAYIGEYMRKIRTGMKLNMSAETRKAASERAKIIFGRPEVREKVRQAHKLRMQDPELRRQFAEKVSKALTGIKRSRESVEKTRAAITGLKRNEEQRRLISEKTREAMHRPDILAKIKRRPVQIHGVRYETREAAIKALNIGLSTLDRHLTSTDPKWKDWTRLPYDS